jgi:hypothetical protein
MKTKNNKTNNKYKKKLERKEKRKITQKKVRKKRKINKESNKDKIFHFFDDDSAWMKGITFSKDEKKIESIMCTNNIVCHKTKNQEDNIGKKKYNNLLNIYISKISNKNMVNFIKLQYNNYIDYNINKKNNIYNSFFDPYSGLTDDQIHFLLNPNLKDVIIGFDMDSTLHQTAGFANKPLKIFIKNISELTKSKITINDVGEYYFGGKERLQKIKEVFQNLNKTITMKNVYIITANQSSLIPEILPYFYSKLFDIKFLKSNIKVANNKNLSKYDIIKEIMK